MLLRYRRPRILPLLERPRRSTSNAPLTIIKWELSFSLDAPWSETIVVLVCSCEVAVLN